jgi:transposase
MNETLEEFYNHLLGIESPWEVKGIKRNSQNREVTVSVGYKENAQYLCPQCGTEGRLYDHRPRRWRHLDSCNHKTIIEADIPRVECSEHGVKQGGVSWAEKNSRFTLEFERAVIIWLKEASVSAVSEFFDISWDEADGIMGRAVRRGEERRGPLATKNLGIDETSFQKRHEYVTVLLDKDEDVVIDILDDRKAKTLKTWFNEQKTTDFEDIESITMDMWDPYINAVRASFGNADEIIAFDRFHVAGHLNKAVDKVRASEHREFLAAGGISPLIRSRYHWLRNSGRTDNRTVKRKEFLSMTRLNLKTARAWRIKEAASLLWDYSYMGSAVKAWKRLLYWISHCRLKPMIAVGKTIRKYFWGILNAIKLKANNSMLEAKNARIQRIKKMACGFRNRTRFRNVILFHLGGLDLMPSATR